MHYAIILNPCFITALMIRTRYYNEIKDSLDAEGQICYIYFGIL